MLQDMSGLFRVVSYLRSGPKNPVTPNSARAAVDGGLPAPTGPARQQGPDIQHLV